MHSFVCDTKEEMLLKVYNKRYKHEIGKKNIAIISKIEFVRIGLNLNHVETNKQEWKWSEIERYVFYGFVNNFSGAFPPLFSQHFFTQHVIGTGEEQEKVSLWSK